MGHVPGIARLPVPDSPWHANCSSEKRRSGMKLLRCWLIVLLLAATAGLIQVRNHTDRVPLSEPLSRLPHSIGNWSGRDFPIDPETIAVLGKGDFLSRAY